MRNVREWIGEAEWDMIVQDGMDKDGTGKDAFTQSLINQSLRHSR